MIGALCQIVAAVFYLIKQLIMSALSYLHFPSSSQELILCKRDILFPSRGQAKTPLGKRHQQQQQQQKKKKKKKNEVLYTSAQVHPAPSAVAAAGSSTAAAHTERISSVVVRAVPGSLLCTADFVYILKVLEFDSRPQNNVVRCTYVCIPARRGSNAVLLWGTAVREYGMLLVDDTDLSLTPGPDASSLVCGTTITGGHS